MLLDFLLDLLLDFSGAQPHSLLVVCFRFAFRFAFRFWLGAAPQLALSLLLDLLLDLQSLVWGAAGIILILV